MRDNDIVSVYMKWVENPGDGKPAELTVLNHQNYFVMLCRVIDKHTDWVKKRVRFIVSELYQTLAEVAEIKNLIYHVND